MTEREAAAASARPLPPLPPIDTKDSLRYDQIRYVSGYPAEYVRQYATDYARAALAYIAASAPQAVRRPLTEEQIRTMRSEAKADPRCAEEHWFVLLVRAAEKYHGIVPLAPQDTGGK